MPPVRKHRRPLSKCAPQLCWKSKKALSSAPSPEEKVSHYGYENSDEAHCFAFCLVPVRKTARGRGLPILATIIIIFTRHAAQYCCSAAAATELKLP